MYYKEDWEASRKRFEALWQGETLDRCCISVTAPRPGSEDFLHATTGICARAAGRQSIFSSTSRMTPKPC